MTVHSAKPVNDTRPAMFAALRDNQAAKKNTLA